MNIQIIQTLNLYSNFMKVETLLWSRLYSRTTFSEFVLLSSVLHSLPRGWPSLLGLPESSSPAKHWLYSIFLLKLLVAISVSFKDLIISRFLFLFFRIFLYLYMYAFSVTSFHFATFIPSMKSHEIISFFVRNVILSPQLLFSPKRYTSENIILKDYKRPTQFLYVP